MSVEARGRGRVVPRASTQQAAAAAPSTAQAPSLALPAAASRSTTAAVALQPQQAASNNSNSSVWRCAGFITANSKPVLELPVSKLASGTASRLLCSGQPLLLKQLHLARCSLQQQRPASHHLASAAQPQQQAPGAQDLLLPVLCSPAEANRFLRADASKNTPGCYYHVRKPETSTVQLTFNDWLQCWQSWTANTLLLQVGLGCGRCHSNTHAMYNSRAVVWTALTASCSQSTNARHCRENRQHKHHRCSAAGTCVQLGAVCHPHHHPACLAQQRSPPPSDAAAACHARQCTNKHCSAQQHRQQRRAAAACSTANPRLGVAAAGAAGWALGTRWLAAPAGGWLRRAVACPL